MNMDINKGVENIEEHNRDELISTCAFLSSYCFSASARKGFWADYYEALDRCETVRQRATTVTIHKLSKLALVVSEVGEAMEGVRKPGPDSHCPQFTSEEVELADTIIRIFDYCGANPSIRLAQAIIAKLEYNASRPHMHGKGA